MRIDKVIRVTLACLSPVHPARKIQPLAWGTPLALANLWLCDLVLCLGKTLLSFVARREVLSNRNHGPAKRGLEIRADAGQLEHVHTGGLNALGRRPLDGLQWTRELCDVSGANVCRRIAHNDPHHHLCLENFHGLFIRVLRRDDRCRGGPCHQLIRGRVALAALLKLVAAAGCDAHLR